jgi:hypothetical protein
MIAAGIAVEETAGLGALIAESKVPALAVASEGCLRSVPGAQAQALPGSGPVDGGNGKLAQASTPFALCSMTRQQRKSLALDGGSCRFSMMTRKAKPRRQGEVDHSCLSLAVGLPVMPTLQPRTLPSDLTTSDCRHR